MRRLWWFGPALLGMALLAGPAFAGSGPATTEGTLPAPGAAAPGDLPLVLSIRALSVGPTTFTDSGDAERIRTTNGAGTSRWPSASTPIGRGVYISVMPTCVPGVDEPLWPGPPRRRR